MIRFAPLFLLCSGCAVVPSWEMIGVTSTSTHNKHVEESAEFAKDAVANQGRIVEITHELNQENIYIAKAKDDIAMLERTYKTAGKISHAKEVSEELSSREFTKAPDPPFDWGTIINMLIGLATGGTTMGAVVLSLKGKLKAVASEAIANGESTDKNDTSHLKKLT